MTKRRGWLSPPPSKFSGSSQAGSSALSDGCRRKQWKKLRRRPKLQVRPKAILQHGQQ